MNKSIFVYLLQISHLYCQSISHRFQSSTSNRSPTSSTSGIQDIDGNESFLSNRDTAQAIADEEIIDSVEQATSSRAELISQAMKNYLLKSREKR